MDNRTVYGLSCLYLLATGGLVGLAARSYPAALRRDGYRWAAGVVLLAAGLGFVALRGRIADAASILGAHGASVAGIGALYVSLERFQGRRPRWPWVWLPLPAALASAVFTHLVSPNYGLRVALFSAITGSQFLLCALALARGPSPAPRTARLAAVGFAACSALLLVRAGASLAIMPAASPQTILRGTRLEQTVIVALFIWFFVLSFSFLLLCNDKLNGELRSQAAHDVLTGALNRRAIADLAEREIARARRHGQALAVALIDLDGLKGINDAHGHGAGDVAIGAVARGVARAIRAEDTLGRWGGDEFLLLMPETAGTAAKVACERARQAVKSDAPERLAAPHAVTFSVGVAWAAGANLDLQTLLAAADAALYNVKRTGGDGACVMALGEAPAATEAVAG